MKKLFSLSVPRIVAFVTIIVLALKIFHFVSPQTFPFLSALELKLLDTKFKTRGSQKADSRIVILAIDDESINLYGRWPWDRNILAKAIQKLNSANPATVALDMVFSESDPHFGDNALAQALSQSQNIVLGYFFYFDKELPTQKKLPSSINLKISSEPTRENVIPKALSVEMNRTPIAEATEHYGFFDFPQDEDGAVRRGNLIVEYGEGLYPSFALKTVSLYLKKNIGVRFDKEGVNHVFLDDVVIPSDESGSLLVNFRGGKNTYPHYSFKNVLQGKIENTLLRNKIILMGVTARAVQDLRTTPFSTDMSGVEVHANIIDNILNQNFLKRSFATFVEELFFIILLGMFLSFGLKRMHSKIGLLFTLGLTSFIYCGDLFFIFEKGIWAHTLFIYIQVYLTFVDVIFYKYFVEERRAKQIRAAFEHYLAPALVEELIRDPSKLQLRGEKKVLTVLFADIRDFTKLSEKLDPNLLTKMINEYMTAMTDVVFEQGGLIDKYMGDAIMVIYGAPVPSQQHADQAIQTSLAMLSRLAELNESWKMQRLPTLQMGIGIHTGEMLVGNMGSSRIFDYTVIGDSVNLASRLEKATKFYKVPIIISGKTKELLHKSYLVRKLDNVQVRGRSEEITLYEVLKTEKTHEEHQKEVILLYEKALSSYENRKFEEALMCFKEIEDIQEHDYPTEIFLKRCEDQLLSPPPRDWKPIHKL